MTRLNPNDPETSGLEWLPTRGLTFPLKVGGGTGVEFLSSASETIQTIFPRISAAAAAQIGVDVYDAGDIWLPNEVYGGVDAVNADVGSTAGFGTSTDGGVTWTGLVAGTAHTFLNKDIPDTYTHADIAALVVIDGHVLRYLPAGTQKRGHIVCSGPGTYTKITDGTSGNNPTGDRVGWIEVNIAAKAFNGASPTVDGWIRLGSTDYGSDDGPRRISSTWARYTYRFFTNPATGRQWTSAEIAEFLTSGGSYGYGFEVVGPAGTHFQFAAINIVFRALPERRVITGYGVAAAGDAWCSIPTLDPTDHSVANWAKSNGLTYLVNLYLTGTGGNAALVALDEATLAEQVAGTLTNWFGATAAALSGSAVIAADPVLGSWAPALYLETSAPAVGVDAQPYTRAGSWPVASTDGADSDAIVAGASDDYGIVSVVVARLSAVGQVTTPDANLVVTLDGSATGEIAPADVPADGRWHLLQVRLDSSVAASGGSPYTVSFSTASTVPWAVARIGSDGAAEARMIGQDAVFDGAADTSVNILVNMKTVPAPIVNFQAILQSTSPQNAPPGGPAEVPTVGLVWDASALGGEFAYYEIQRQTNAYQATDWVSIFHVTDEATTAVTDQEPLPGATETYRMRVVRTDGAFSDWTDEMAVGPPLIDCGYVLAANSALGGASLLAYQESGDGNPTHSFSRANSGTATVHLIQGRDDPAAFRNRNEGDSDVFQRDFIVAIDLPGVSARDTGNWDREAFVVLLALIEDPTVQYVSLCDSRGRRWYTFPEFVTGSFSWQGNEARATVKFTEIAPSPTVVTDVPL